MKKSLLAVAALGAFASAAQAQSSVTVYGILDVGYTNTNTRYPSGVASQPNGQTNKSGITQSAEQSSRLGFKGSEDLGGGSSAFFTVELGLTPVQNGISQTASNTVSLNNRQSFAGLKKNGIGQFAIGTQYTPIHNAFAATDPGQNNNVVGNVVRPATGTDGGQTSSSAAYTISTSNTLTVQSDSFSGFRVGGNYVQNNTNTTQFAGNTTVVTNGGNTNFSGFGLSTDYTWNKLFATAAYQSYKNQADNSAPLSPTATNAIKGATTNIETSLPNTTDTQYYVGGTYDFGILKAYANYINRKLTNDIASNQYLKRTAQQVGVRSYITPTIEGWASVGSGRYTAFGANQPTANFNAWQLGSNYWLSKRTNLYAIYGQVITGGTTTTTYTQGAAASQVALGVRHTF
jgi:predicted porin